MAKPSVPRALLDPVVAYFKPQRVILFGSKARGEAGRDSDIDLLVVVDDDTPAEKLTWRARHEARKAYRRPADIFPIRAETFEEDRSVIGTLAAEADIDGIVVYGSPKGPPLMKTADPAVRWRAVERWLKVADADRKAVELCIAADPPLRGIAAFHCQQAVEKLLKGFLTLAGKRSRKTHLLSQLGAMAQESFPELAEFVASVDNWSKWVGEFRYPGGAELEPDEAELRRALDVIDRLAASLRAKRP
jgi:HEPN domain-containing protein/predicted nucleotidyltransferase